MGVLVGLPGLDQELRVTLRSLGRRMDTVTDMDLSPAAFRNVQLHRNVARYAFVVNLCSLIARSLLPDEKTGSKRFHPFTTSEQEMGLLFQAFVRNFPPARAGRVPGLRTLRPLGHRPCGQIGLCVAAANAGGCDADQFRPTSGHRDEILRYAIPEALRNENAHLKPSLPDFDIRLAASRHPGTGTRRCAPICRRRRATPARLSYRKS